MKTKRIINTASAGIKKGCISKIDELAVFTVCEANNEREDDAQSVGND
ncbi:MAG: hypothetical protein AAF639_05005 [Chloroflexota bacterium]